MLAARTGRLDIAQLLVAAGARRELVDSGGSTALLVHCSAPAPPQPQLVQLLATSRSVDTVCGSGWWPLLALVARDRGDQQLVAQCVAAVLRAGADPSLATPLGCSPLHLALHRGCWGTGAVLVRAGAEVGGALLGLALARGNTAMASLLAAAGARPALSSAHRCGAVISVEVRCIYFCWQAPAK